MSRTDSKSAKDAAYLKRYNEFLKNGGGGESGVLLTQEFDNSEYASGNMSKEEHDDRLKARAAGAGTGFVLGMGALAVAPVAGAAGTTGTVTVTSWAPEGVVADLAEGRWVMQGGATYMNYFRTFLWGPTYTVGEGFAWQGAGMANSITGEVAAESVAWPAGLNWVRGLFGQRVLTAVEAASK